MKKITVIVPLVGISLGKTTTQIQTEGFVGTQCVDATRGLQAALGTTVKDEATAEQFEQEVQQEFLRDGGT